MTTTSDRVVRIALVADGPPRAIGTNSGVSKNLLEALAARPDVEIVGEIDAHVRGVSRALVRLVSFRPSAWRWRRTVSWGTAKPRFRSLLRDLKISTRRTEIDLVIHVRNFYFPTQVPYAAFIDTTMHLRRMHMPEVRIRDADYERLIDIEQNYFTHATHVFTVSDYVRKDLIESYGVDPQSVSVVGAGLRKDFVVRPKPVPQLNMILFVGRDFDRKGGWDLVQAFAIVRERFPEATLEIVGSTPNISAPGVVIHGDVQDIDELSKIYSRAAVFSLPAHFEPFGLVVLEALASGIPCVVTDVGALREIIETSGGGVVVEPRSIPELARALEELLADADLRAKLGLAGRNYARQSWEDVAGRIMSAIVAA